jgi:hypothetical protein
MGGQARSDGPDRRVYFLALIFLQQAKISFIMFMTHSRAKKHSSC